MLLKVHNPLAWGGLRGDIREEFDRLVNDLWNTAWPVERQAPALNLWDNGDALYAEVEVPGWSMNDLEVFVLDDQLTIKGRRPAQAEDQTRYHRRERTVTEFNRTLPLPLAIHAEAVEASLSNGVLTVKLPKAPQAQPRRIEVKGL